MCDFGQYLDLWPAIELSEDLGISYVAAQAIKRRGRAAAHHWPALLRAATARARPVTLPRLLEMWCESEAALRQSSTGRGRRAA